MLDEPLMRRADAAKYLHQRVGAYTAQTLAKLACTGGGPRFVKVGHFPLYKASDIEQWIAARMSPLVAHNSELGLRKEPCFRQQKGA